jgi:hypothetical protein
LETNSLSRAAIFFSFGYFVFELKMSLLHLIVFFLAFEEQLRETERRAQEALNKLKSTSNRPPAPPWTRQRDDRIVSYSYQSLNQVFSSLSLPL